MSNKELKEKLSELAKMKDTESCIEDQIDTLVMNRVLKDFPKIGPLDIYCPFEHKCKKSPFGYCVYDESENSAVNNCLYCGEPHERNII